MAPSLVSVWRLLLWRTPAHFRLLILIQFGFIDDRGNVVSQTLIR